MKSELGPLKAPKSQEVAHVKCPCGNGEVQVWLREEAARMERHVAVCDACGQFGPFAGAQRSAINAWRRKYAPGRIAECEARRRRYGDEPLSSGRRG